MIGAWGGGSFTQGSPPRYAEGLVFGIDAYDLDSNPANGHAYDIVSGIEVANLGSKWNAGQNAWAMNGPPLGYGVAGVNLPAGSAPRTVIALFKWNGVVAGGEPGVELLGWGPNSYSARFGLWLTVGRMGSENGGSVSAVDIPRGSTEWAHLAMVLSPGDSDQSQLKLYANGSLGSNFSGSGPINTGTTHNVMIGGLAELGYYPFTGLLSRVLIYDRALSAEEVQADFLAVQGRMGF